MHQIYFICNGTVEPTKPIYIYKRCNRSWIYESWNLLRVRGYNKSREKWISFLNIAWWPECDVFAMSQIGRKCIAKRHRNHVAVMFHGDFDIKSHSCPDAMSQLGRSCVSWRLSYKVASMSHWGPDATSQSGRTCVPRRLLFKVALMFQCDVAIRSQLCFMATFIYDVISNHEQNVECK